MTEIVIFVWIKLNKMQKMFSLLFTVICLQTSAQTLRTTYSDDFSRWDFDGQQYRTTYSNDFFSWDVNGIRIRSTYSKDPGSWDIGNSTKLRTTYSNDLSRWEIRGNSKTIYVKTTYSNDFSRWDVSGDASGSMRTTYSNDYDRWDIQVKFEGVPDEMKYAVVFVPIYISNKQK